MKSLYPIIYKRKSVRKFMPESLSVKQKEEILVKWQEVKNELDIDISYRIEYLENESISGIFNVTSPSAFGFYCDDHPLAYVYTGFMFQQFELLLSSLSVGSCWLGMAKPTDMMEIKGFKNRAVLAVGLGSQSIYRSSKDQFKRIPILEICDDREWDFLVEAVSLAPSSVNRQPWYLEISDYQMILRPRKMGILNIPYSKRLLQIDLGIALCHLIIALEHYDISYQVELNVDIQVKDDWIAKISIKQ